MKNRKITKAICFILTIYTLIGSGAVAFADSGVGYACEIDAAEECAPVLSENVKVGSRFWELFFGEQQKEKDDTVTLIPGGEVFGVKIKQKQVTVTDAKGVPALKSGDVIISINGESINSAADVKRIVENSAGNSLTIRALHADEEIGVEIKPTYRDGAYQIGLSVRDGAAGLGTVTFIDPETGAFGGLGHGICDSESGDVIEMRSGDVCGVILGGVHKGESGKPGELCGILTEKDLGDLSINNECGVFGVITEKAFIKGDAIPVGRREEVTEGEATIISTIKNGKSGAYKIEIYDIDRGSDGSKSFRIRITDDTLKALTGGIVRGMSGSPIIQNGKLVGAVTHVLVADPTEGYGIFIENMLSASGSDTLPKAA